MSTLQRQKSNVKQQQSCTCNSLPLKLKITCCAMTTYCILCQKEIPDRRQRRSSRTCSPACQREYRRQYLQERAQRICKACGRPRLKQSPSRPGNSVPEASQTTVEPFSVIENPPGRRG